MKPAIEDDPSNPMPSYETCIFILGMFAGTLLSGLVFMVRS